MGTFLQVLRKRSTTQWGKRKRAENKLHRLHRCKLKKINEAAQEARLRHAAMLDLTNLVRLRDNFTASLVKYERRYGSDKAELAKKRLLIFNEEAAQVKRWV